MTHGSPELDEDAAKLAALGQDPGPTLADLEQAFDPSKIMLSSAEAVADEAVECFSRRHPDIKMTFDQWLDLKEIISREMRGLQN